ncbi:HAD hydrolase-like protein [Candidatus Dependentiae bacterium]|nr:HAD hydrolase-like protein [Candidatus Dependentiae bacterium]
MIKNYLHCLSDAITPETTVIAFDLHNVVFKMQTQKVVVSCIKLMPKGTWRYAFNPVLWYRACRFKVNSNVAEDIFHKLAIHYPGLARFRGDFIQITNNQRPIVPVVELIMQLKQRGYKLYVLSNIGKDTFFELSMKYPEISACFDGAFTATAENNYNHKPHKKFYEQFKDFLAANGQSHKQILFVDDLKKNIVAATHCNIGGIHYTSSKQLVSQFKNLHIV